MICGQSTELIFCYFQKYHRSKQTSLGNRAMDIPTIIQLKNYVTLMQLAWNDKTAMTGEESRETIAEEAQAKMN